MYIRILRIEKEMILHEHATTHDDDRGAETCVQSDKDK